MPPRKRAESAPKPDPDEGTAPAVEEEGTSLEPEPDGPRAPQDSDDDGTGEPMAAPPDETTPDPERSDLQAVEQPCAECVPNGWPAQAYAVGCTHGTWQREALD